VHAPTKWGRAGFQDPHAGRGVVPMTSLLERDKEGFSRRMWLALHPSARRGLPHKYMPVVEGELKTGENLMERPPGMERPCVPLGSLQLECTLALAMPVHLCYIQRPIRKRGPHFNQLTVQTGLVRHVQRLSRALTRPPRWLVALYEIRAWQSKPLSGAVLVAYVYVSLLAPLWSLPVVAAFVISCCSLLERGAPADEVCIWNDEIVDDRNAFEKTSRAVRTLTAIQTTVDSLATAAERCRNVFNWSDPHVSTMCLVVMWCVASGVSFCWYIAVAIGNHLDISFLSVTRTVVFLSGLASLLPIPGHHQPMSEEGHQGGGSFLTRPVELCNRIPDGLECAHRRIAEEQIIPPP